MKLSSNPTLRSYLKHQHEQEVHDSEHACEDGCTHEVDARDPMRAGSKELPLRYYPDPILKQKCEPVTEVTEELRQLAQDMILTMMLSGGVGLAANQVGKLVRLFVADVEWVRDGIENSKSYVFFNPKLSLLDEYGSDNRRTVTEGCLSFPRAGAKMDRFPGIKITAMGLDGKWFDLEARGTLAIAIQHEYDHLDGITIESHISKIDMGITRVEIQKALRKKKAETKKSLPRKKKLTRR